MTVLSRRVAFHIQHAGVVLSRRSNSCTSAFLMQHVVTHIFGALVDLRIDWGDDWDLVVNETMAALVIWLVSLACSVSSCTMEFRR